MTTNLPETISAWQNAVDNTPLRHHILNGVGAIDTRAQYFGKISASKMKLEDFLALRVLWSERDATALKSQRLFDQDVLDMADKVLDELPGWKDYKDHLRCGDYRAPYLVRGDAFGLVDHYFRNVLSLDKDEPDPKPATPRPCTPNRPMPTREQSDIPDPSDELSQTAYKRETYWMLRTARFEASGSQPHTRNSSDTSSIDAGPSPARMQRESAPSPASSRAIGRHRGHSNFSRDGPLDDIMEVGRLDLGEQAFDREFSTASASTLASMRTIEPQDPEQYSLKPDEQVVNLALLVFLTTITVAVAEVNATWCIDRLRFRLSPTLEARTDGYLRYRKRRNLAAALIECKARVREACKPEVQYQEADQHSAWIFEEDIGDLHSPLSKEDGLRRRISVSMNQGEVYIIVATFGHGYKQFLDTTSARMDDSYHPYPVNNDSFMRMRSYGPFEVHDGPSLKALARYLAAISITQNSDHIPKEPDSKEASYMKAYNTRAAGKQAASSASSATEGARARAPSIDTTSEPSDDEDSSENDCEAIPEKPSKDKAPKPKVQHKASKQSDVKHKHSKDKAAKHKQQKKK